MIKILPLFLFACSNRSVETFSDVVEDAAVQSVWVQAVDGRVKVESSHSGDGVTVDAILRSSHKVDEEDADDAEATDAADAAAIAGVDFSVQVVGSVAEARATLSDDVASDYWLDVTVIVPPDMPAEIGMSFVREGVSGLVTQGIKAFDLAGVTITDESGTIEVRRISGDVVIDDASGSVKVVKVEGDVDIVDEDGVVVVKHVTGDLTVTDGKGRVKAVDVEGTSNIDSESGKVVEK
jgi:hypothetical protein